MFKRILIPLDGSARAESAIPVAARIARAYGASITLLKVEETPVEYNTYVALSASYTKEAIKANLAEASGGMQHFMLGSVTERVLHHSNLPLLIVRPPKEKKSGKKEKDEQDVDVAVTKVEVQSWVGLL